MIAGKLFFLLLLLPPPLLLFFFSSFSVEGRWDTRCLISDK